MLALTGPVQAQQVTWKLQSLLNPGYMGTDAEIWFAQEVEKRTGGKLKVTVYPGAALGFAEPAYEARLGRLRGVDAKKLSTRL